MIFYTTSNLAVEVPRTFFVRLQITWVLGNRQELFCFSPTDDDRRPERSISLRWRRSGGRCQYSWTEVYYTDTFMLGLTRVIPHDFWQAHEASLTEEGRS